MDQADASQDAGYSMRFADALCARLCHDLSSPLGTLMGALEMVAEDPSALEDAIPIASETAAAMVARLKLLRAAWAGDCGPLTAAQLSELAAGLPSRIRTDLTALGGTSFDGAVSRVLLNLLLLGAEALPRGGVVAMSAQDGGGIMVTLEGKAAAWPANLTTALVDPASIPLDNPRMVQAPMTVMLAQAAGRRLSLVPALAGDPGAVEPLLLSHN